MPNSGERSSSILSTGKKLSAGFIVFTGIALFFLLWFFYNDGSRMEQISLRNTSRLESTEETDQTDAGAQVHTAVLPDAFGEEQTILFKTTHTIVEVRVDGNLIYEYGREKEAPGFMKSPGTLWHLAEIPADSAGGLLEVRIYPVYKDFYGNEPVFFYGTREGCIMELFRSVVPVLVINCIIVFAGILSILLHIATFGKRDREEIGSFLLVGFFSLMIAVWSLCQSGILQFLIPDGRTLYYVDFFSFYLFPVPFNLFVYDITRTKYRRGLLWMAGAYLVNMAAALVLQCAGIIDIFRILPVTHLLMAVNVAYVIRLIHHEFGKGGNKDAGKFRLPMYTVMVFAAAELVMYYVRSFRKTSVFLPLGTFVFIVMLIWMQVVRYYDRRLEEEKLAYFKKLANTDVLTGALNRNSYEDTVKYLEEKEPDCRKLGVILIDINDMKHINDLFGHEKGDEALKQCYQCVCAAFGTQGRCFRIGGDEFAYLFDMYDKPDIEGEVERFERIMEETGQKVPYPFSAAVGYACYEEETDRGFRDVIRRSDTMMYRRKWKKKLQQSAGTEKEAADARYMENVCVGDPENSGNRMKEYRKISVESLCSFIDLLNPSTDGYLFVLDFRTDFYYIAPHALERFSLENNAFHNVTENLRKLVYKEDFSLLRADLDDLRESGRCIHNLEYRWLDKSGKPVWINCRGYVVRDDDDNRLLYMIGCINEIGVRQKADNVSGLLGETSLMEYLDGLEGHFPKGYVLRLGIDKFKDINEKFGMDYGDMILRETATCISHCLHHGQRLYRLMSDEFIILDFSGGTKDSGLALFYRIQELLEEFVEHNSFDVVFTISGGFVTSSILEKDTYSDVMKLTEFALNEAKARGRNRCYLFRKEDYEVFLHKRELSRILRSAINHDFQGFRANYQPLFCSEDNSLYGAEVLMRFYGEECGEISPVEFIPILEEEGLILPAGRWILREGLEKCKEIRKYFPEFKVSVNVSNVQVAKSNLLAEVTSALRDTGMPATALILELTESGLLEAGTDSGKLWKELGSMGIKLALDDFGTGYSNFHYLGELQPDIIKIDRSFVSKALANKAEYYILSLLSSMTHNLQLKLCIEGVENGDEWKQLQLLFPDYAQGYYWGRPCSYDMFMEKFVNNSGEK